MILTVIKYDAAKDHHVCIDDKNVTHNVDFMVMGDLGEESIKKINSIEEYIFICQSLIGQEIEVASLNPYIEIAHGSKIVDDNGL